MSDKQTEKISDKRMYWRISGASWTFFFICCVTALYEWLNMVGWKAGIFIGFFLALSSVLTYLAVKQVEVDPSDTSEG